MKNNQPSLISKESVAYLAKLAYDNAGIWIDVSREYFFHHRLHKIVERLKLPDFDAYCEFLRRGSKAEIQTFIDAITTTVTSFFRESAQFDYLASTVVPQLMQKNEQTHEIKIWSAGCSNGEEAYTIAMVMAETIPQLKDWDIKILATDINSIALNRGREGVYPEEEIEFLSADRKKNFFLHGKNQQQGKVLIKPAIKQMVHFKNLNLISAWPMQNQFDIIFCRNVIIYFNKKTQRTLFRKFDERLNRLGYLFIGQAESLKEVSDDFELIKNAIYVKKREASLFD